MRTGIQAGAANPREAPSEDDPPVQEPPAPKPPVEDPPAHEPDADPPVGDPAAAPPAGAACTDQPPPATARAAAWHSPHIPVQVHHRKRPSLTLVATFSIVAYEPTSRSWGVAVQSRFLAAGSIVPWAKAEVGAVATQAFANPRFGPLGLTLLEHGLDAREVVAALIAGDPGRELRQVGVVDREGRVAAFTGAECLPWAGHVIGEHCCCQGNILAGPTVVDAMAAVFSQGRELRFPERLVAALAAGRAEGGDIRGQQSAALLVVRPKGGFMGYSDRAVDVRVDDHPTPIDELSRLLDLHRGLMGG